MTTVTDKTTSILRSVRTNKAAKEIRDAMKRLDPSEVIIRACGLWLDRDGENVDLTESKVPVRDIRSTWIETNVNDKWIFVRRNDDPHLEPHQAPRIEIEAVFPTQGDLE